MQLDDCPVVQKPTPGSQFVDHGTDREMRWEVMRDQGYFVPNELFYVRNHSPTPRIDPATWRLRIDGSAVEKPTDVSYDQIRDMPHVTLPRALECAGNGRRFFGDFQSTPISGTQWRLGAVGVAEWSGVPLRDVLALAGVQPTARDVMIEGLDDCRFRRPIPIEKALADDTLLVTRMNGVTLPPDHGYPVRLLASGWAAVSSIKWVGRIQVADEPLYSPWNTEDYVLMGDGYMPEPPALGPPLTSLNVKSAIELPWNAELAAGLVRLTGRAWSANGSIARVEFSSDGGNTWHAARLRGPNHSQAWACWEIDWDATPGDHTLHVRATDDQGNTQPDLARVNEKGYLFGAVVPHPVRVT